MKIAVIHGEVGAGAGRDEQDVLMQAAAVSQGLATLGHETVTVTVSLNLAAAVQALAELRPAMVFNLVETIAGKGSLIHLVPALLDALKIPYTGAGTDAMFLTSNKLLAKRWLAAAGLPTPAWFTAQGTPCGKVSPMHEGLPIEGPWLIKSVWEHASIGLDEDSVLFGADRKGLLAEMDARCEALGGVCLAEAYIDGREFNLSLLAGEGGTEVLPPAEIRFDSYPPGKVRVVGYRSKWEEGTFEFANTPRTFQFPAQDAPLLSQLKELAHRCWKIFDLQGYARVDFRVDKAGRPWILEVNANPCLSPDAGFSAATLRAGLTFTDVLCRILKNGGDLTRA
ncbi:MAG: D-alanine--D-alanine ligase [Proteobacteria bacterium]|nr:D-alanine--D-alanine ligase [Pseudomonadota bacterium]